MKDKIINKINDIKGKISKDKKYKKKFIISVIGIILGIVILITACNASSNKSTITYNGIEKIIKNKDSAIIYYFNSNSSNMKNIRIMKYLDKLKINYYKYNDANVDKEEYKKFLKLMGLDKTLFGPPSIIYLKNGRMYGNAIRIDSNKAVKQLVDQYDLYTVK